jgi:hypothetical protein
MRTGSTVIVREGPGSDPAMWMWRGVVMCGDIVCS